VPEAKISPGILCSVAPAVGEPYLCASNADVTRSQCFREPVPLTGAFQFPFLGWYRMAREGGGGYCPSLRKPGVTGQLGSDNQFLYQAGLMNRTRILWTHFKMATLPSLG
jgi:hypothetical protein